MSPIDMDLIVTHKDADFDALSSLVAAKKLYPKARLLLPGSQEKAVRNFMSLFKEKFPLEDEKTCRMDDVRRLIIVDNRHRSRIGAAADLLEKKGLEVHIYDHHPRTKYDIKADKDVFKEVGATVSLLLDILLRKGRFDLTPLEATLMLLGIYEETGSLSYRTTTKLDVDMVSALLGKGANLNAVSSYLNRELDGDELKALVNLLESIEVVRLDAIDVAFAKVDVSKFAGETGTVVHKLQDVENYPVIFAVFTSGEKIKVLARSRIELVDVNKLLSRFGGAGHSSAASVRFVGKRFDRIKSDIIEELRKMVHQEIHAVDIMSFPVWTVFQEEKVDDVMKKMRRAGYKGAPVLDNLGDLVGVISLTGLKKALARNMGHSRIKGYMAAGPVTAEPETPLHVLRNIMRDKNRGQIPIIRDGKLVGIVARTDVLKRVHSSLFKEKKRPKGVLSRGEGRPKERVSFVSEKIRTALPKKLVQMIRLIGREADSAGMNVFLVGGFVRDIILGVKNYDLDIVVEGDAIHFGRVLKKKLGGALVIHRKFGTATLVKDWPAWLGPSLHPDNKFKIDIAMARKEKYEKPAALPVVKFSSLRHDLFRRDFTINAMAVKINKADFGLFVDFFGGMKDLEEGVIKTLHDKSFLDDPTRIFRAVRFEQRFGFQIEKHTEYLIQHAIKQEMFRRTENQRIRDEVILMLEEESPEKAVFRMKELHELRFIHPELALTRSTGRMFKEAQKCIRWYDSRAAKKRKLTTWLINFLIMIESLSPEQAEEVLGKFVFARSVTTRIRSYKEKERTVRKKLSSSKKAPPSFIYRLLEPLPHEVILCIMAKTASTAARRRIRKFFAEYNGTELKIKGHDIRAEGITPGPRYKEILSQVLYEKLDGKLPTKKAEIKYMREYSRRFIHVH